jgi:arginine decarboxylase
MQIRVFSAGAPGPTPLAAFDRALQVGGAHDTNLIVLSSVVPVGATVVRGRAADGEFTIGDRLYCVMAEQRAIEPGAEAWAGLAWAVDVDGRGGLFVEAHGHTEHQVRFDLEQTLDALVADRPYLRAGEHDLELAGATCDGHPVCALVMAIYESAPWVS